MPEFDSPRGHAYIKLYLASRSSSFRGFSYLNRKATEDNRSVLVISTISAQCQSVHQIAQAVEVGVDVLTGDTAVGMS